MPGFGQNALACAEDLGRLPEILVALPKDLVAAPVRLAHDLGLMRIIKELRSFALVPRCKRQVGRILNTSAEGAVAASTFGFQARTLNLLGKKRLG